MAQFSIQTAERKRAKLKLAISSPSGGGKTYSALRLARGIATSWDKICVIDTENESASLYAHLGPFKILNLAPPHAPQRYVEAIDYVERAGCEVLIIDSVSHEWVGEGGCLEMQARLGGRHQDWAKVTPLHRAFIDKILQTPMHVIGTIRKKTDWAIDSNSNGKTTPRKVGLADVQRDGLEYEWSIAFSLSQNHLASVEKDRTGLLMGRPEFILTEDVGAELLRWSLQGSFEQEAGQNSAPTTGPVTAIAASQELAKDPAIKVLFDKLESLEGKTIDSHKRFLGVHARAGDADQRGAVIAGLEKKISVMAAKQQPVQV